MSLTRFAREHKAGLIAAALVAWCLCLAVAVADRWLDLGLFPTALERKARRAIDALEGPEPERSRAMHRLGTEIDPFAAVPQLIRALGSSSLPRRAGAVECLRRISGTTQGYVPDGPEAQRRAAIERWRAWWQAHNRWH